MVRLSSLIIARKMSTNRLNYCADKFVVPTDLPASIPTALFFGRNTAPRPSPVSRQRASQLTCTFGPRNGSWSCGSRPTKAAAQIERKRIASKFGGKVLNVARPGERPGPDVRAPRASGRGEELKADLAAG